MKDLIENLRTFFAENKTKSLEFRISALKRLKKEILNNYDPIILALKNDLGKSEQESYLTEIAMIIKEIELHIKHLKNWSKDKNAATPLALFPSRSYIKKEPYGVVLIMGAWNYPIQLSILPLVGAISAGNCAIVKTPEKTPECSKIIIKIISASLHNSHVIAIDGDRDTNIELLEQRFDYIFFTGSSSFGKYIMKKAAENLTPLTLELGGKSPAIIDKTANIELSAKKIVFGKLINSGQTCVAPDYIFVHNNFRSQFKRLLIKYIELFYGINPELSPFYPRMIDKSSLERVISLIPKEKMVYGGLYNKETLYMSPTIIDNISYKDSVMDDEIFGPLFPILYFDEIQETLNYINSKEKPLALYIFGENSIAKHIIENCSSGGVCINDTVIHLANHNLPFGGVGHSGMGQYHGKYSFETFSHSRSILKSPKNFDIGLKYPPYNYFKFIKKLF